METKDRMKMYRERLKADPEKWKLHLEREKERDKKRRYKRKEEIEKSAIKLKLRRKADAERKRKSRQQKKCGTESELPVSPNNCTDTVAYKSEQSFGKALHKAKQSLPSSPSKKIAVIEKLAKEALPGMLRRKSSEQKRTTSSDIKQKVVEFFSRDDISQQAPGRKDVILLKTNGVRTSNQKRHMLMTIKEAFQLFIEENPDLKIKKSKFFLLRPGYVLPLSETPHNVCLCRYHENFQFLIEAAKFSECVLEIPDNILNELCCNTNDEKCMMNLCEKCEKNFDKFLLPGCNLQINISWKQWKEIDGFVRVAEIEGSVAELLEEIAKQLPYFKTQCFVQKKQSFYFKTKKENLEDHEAILQVDFAENFVIMAQNEIQSVHW